MADSHPRAVEIVEAARSLVGVPYRHQGRDRDSGIDCAGVPVVIAREVGISGFDTTRYSRRPKPREMDRAMAEAGCRKIPMKDMAPGDILRLAMPTWPVHCAILDEDGKGQWIIHAWLSARKVVRESLGPERRADIRSVWRFPE